MFSKKKQSIYLDYAAQTPTKPEIYEVMKPWLDGTYFGNASAIHERGVFAKKVLHEARASVKLALGVANASSVVFTSGGTESNTMAIKGALANKEEGVILASSIEHPSVKKLLEEYQDIFTLKEIPITQEGVVDLVAFEEVLKEHSPILVSLMMVNNEIGTVQPVGTVSKLLKEHSSETIFHVDASQAPLYQACSVQSLGIDLMTLCGQKIYGPQGSGALYIKEGINIAPLFFGGSQEKGLRAGTEPMHQIVGFVEALSLAVKNRKAYVSKMDELKDYFLDQLQGVKHVVNGEKYGLPLAVSITFSDTDKTSEEIVSFLNVHGIQVSSKAACMGSQNQDSYVIDALGGIAKNAIRFSLGEGVTKKDLDYVITILKKL